MLTDTDYKTCVDATWAYGCSQGQIFTDVNMLITSPVGYVVKCILWRPNILTFFNLGRWQWRTQKISEGGQVSSQSCDVTNQL